MPRYFFNVHDGSEYSDRTGEELRDLDAAKAFAVRCSGEMLRDHADRFWTGEHWQMNVTDESGLLLFTLMFVAVDAPAVSVRRYKPQNDLA